MWRGILIAVGSLAVGTWFGWRLHTAAAEALAESSAELSAHAEDLARALHKEATFEILVQQLMRDGGMSYEEAVESARNAHRRIIAVAADGTEVLG